MCTDLRQLAGDRFRVWNEPEARRARKTDDRWDLILLGRAGSVAPWAYAPPRGSGALVACTNSAITTRRLLDAVPGSVIVQEGSGGANFVFPAEHLDTVAGILRLRRRRRYTPEQRQELVARLRKPTPDGHRALRQRATTGKGGLPSPR
jgi:hypothetical protein